MKKTSKTGFKYQIPKSKRERSEPILRYYSSITYIARQGHSIRMRQVYTIILSRLAAGTSAGHFINVSFFLFCLPIIYSIKQFFSQSVH
jgi:hypothetical protein